jgi:CMP-N,N'-diacetyllegionaminic acid synthase
MNLLFTICARAGSKGVRSKNTRNFLEYPLLYYTLSAVDLFKKNNINDFNSIDVTINTDSEVLLRSAENAKVPYIVSKRRDEFTGDTVAKIDVIRDAMLQCEEMLHRSYDIVVDLDLTSPLRRLCDLQNLITKINENSKTELVFSVTDARRNPYFNMVQQNADGWYEKVIQSSYVARQQAPSIYDMNASMYAFRSQFLKQSKKLFDANINVIHMIDTAVLDIDNEHDLVLMQVVARHFYDQNPEFAKIYENIAHIRKSIEYSPSV